MKEWEVIFADQKGAPTSIVLQAEHRPSEEDAARAIRTRLFPVMDELDLRKRSSGTIPPLRDGRAGSCNEPADAGDSDRGRRRRRSPRSET